LIKPSRSAVPSIKLEVLGQLYPQGGSLKGRFRGVADLEVEFLGMEVEGGKLRVPRFVLRGQHVRNPQPIDLLIVGLDQLIEAGVTVLMDGDIDDPLVLFVQLVEGVVVVTVDCELLVGVLYQTEGVVFDAADAHVDRAGSSGVVKAAHGLVDGA